MSTIYFSRVRDVKAPTRKNEKSVGIDFYMPELNEELVDVLAKYNKPEVYYVGAESVVVAPQRQIRIPSGIKVKIPHETALVTFNKLHIANERGFDIMARVVDEDYQGEVFIAVNNTSDKYQEIKYGEPIVQFVEECLQYDELEEVGE